ncbi:Ppx/GppA phosphatase family protein [Pseudochrobactrum sp. HB0163]|uniref:Ppx/GppA phosphatase family protein n=1 Tax=Pseudochrobactrum sp. HB0163 TaxID=3450708 RepID=UPI003F6DD79B
MENPELHPRKGSVSGASGGKEGKQASSEPPNTGQRQHRSPVGSSSPLSVTDESGRFDKKQRKRARRRKGGKKTGANAPSTGAQGFASGAEGTVATGGHDKTAPADNAKHQTQKDNSQNSKKFSGRRRRSRRKKTLNNPAPAVQRAGTQTKIQASPQAKSAEKSFTKLPAKALADNQTEKPALQHNGSGNHAASAPVAPARRQNNQLRSYEPPLYAALDLGTNNCRLLVATPGRPGQFRVVDSFSRIVRLGEGFGTSGRLCDQAMNRAIEALKICRDKLESKTIRRRRLIATEACRSASNGAEFLQRVREEAGLELEIVDRKTEASLAVSGCGTLVNRETDALVLFDIGGGSSEIALIDVTCRRSSRLAEHITAWTSLPVGVVTLAEKFGGRDVTPQHYAEMVSYVADLLNDFSERHKLGELAKSTHFHLLGTSGTVTTLAGIHLGLERYDRRRVDGMWMGAQDVTAMTAKLLSWDFNTRVANPCIGADRADLVLAGCAILDAIRQIWPSERLLVADRGLREGILTELMSRDGAWRHRRPYRAKETYNKNNSVRDSQTKGRQSI